MKKLFTLIAVALCAVGANAGITTDVSTFNNYMYVLPNQTLEAGKQCVVKVGLHQDGYAESLGLAVVFPKGYVIDKCAAITTGYTLNSDDEAVIAKQKNTILPNGTTFYPTPTVITGFLTNDNTPNSSWNSTDVEILNITVTVPADAATPAKIILTGFNADRDVETGGEVSVKDSYKVAHGYPYAYERHIVETELEVTGATGVDNVAADGTEVAAPTKKIVDGQLVIETANGTFNAAGAQVK
jgi:invasion protein IalB